jgi:N6-L-threonylcarbamoyladenine synthase
MTRTLAIETSCDETAAAVVESGGKVLSNVIATQIPVHARYGGVVPELASRNHAQAILTVVEKAFEVSGASLDDIDVVSVTQGPGLIGSLLVGLQTAKAIAATRNIPLVGVDHVEAHITAAMLQPPKPTDDFSPVKPPYIAIVASGGHTALYDVAEVGSYKVLGHTVDDAAGEAFDKVAKLVGLPYPGGVAIQNTGENGNPERWDFPRAMMKKGNLNFSFSGLKTAVRNHVESHPNSTSPEELPDLCASVQEAIVDALVKKTMWAVDQTGRKTVVLAGGVAANKRLREKATAACVSRGIQCIRTPMPYCTDNAAMIGGLGLLLYERNVHAFRDLSLDAYANLRMGSPRTYRTDSR